MYTHSHSTVAGLLGLVASCAAIAVPHTIDPRAPHFATILQPEADHVLRANGSSNDTFMFHYSNGNRYESTTLNVSLANGNETYILAPNVTFYNSWYANATLSIVYDQIPDGNYTLIAAEMLDGDIYQEVGQPFGISHDPNSPAPTGTMSDIDPSATSTSGGGSMSSAYILQPGAAPTAATESEGQQQGLSSSRGAQVQNAAASVGTSGGSIEDILQNLVQDLSGN